MIFNTISFKKLVASFSLPTMKPHNQELQVATLTKIPLTTILGKKTIQVYVYINSQ